MFTLVFGFILFNYGSYGSSLLTHIFRLCDIGDITTLNGTIIGNPGFDCTRVILAPKGYRIEVTVHRNTWIREWPIKLIIYDSGTRNGSHERVQISHSTSQDLKFASSSNAIIVHMDKLTNSILNISFVMFPQSSSRCACLPVIDGATVCTVTSVFGQGDTLDRECKTSCRQGYFIPGRFLPGNLSSSCAMDRNELDYRWKPTSGLPHLDQIPFDGHQITCDKAYPPIRVKFGLSFHYNNVSCKNIDMNCMESTIREHIVNKTSVSSVGECFRSTGAKDGQTCLVRSINISCFVVISGTSKIVLLVYDNIVASSNDTVTKQRFDSLSAAFSGNLTRSLKQFVSQNLVIHNTSTSSVRELFISQAFVTACPENATVMFLDQNVSPGCIDCPEHFQKGTLSQNFYGCYQCPIGTRRNNNEQTCVPGQRNYPKPTMTYCPHTCDLGKYFNINASLCEWCPHGFFQDSTHIHNPVCKPCPAGKTTSFVGAEDEERCITPCPAGQYLESSLMCTMCGVGYFTSNDSNILHKCYQCPSGNTTLGIGTASADGCVDHCTVGQYFNLTVEKCLSCPNNTYQDEVMKNNTRSCKKCPLHTVTSSVGSKLQSDCLGPCKAGEYVDVQNRNCSLCPWNTYYQLKEHVSFICNSCGDYKITLSIGSTNVSQCIYDCRKGEFFNATIKICEKCANNTYQHEDGKDFCIPCHGKTFTLKTGSEQCIKPCQFGQFLNKTAEKCQDCPDGYFQNISEYTSETCFPCPLDHYSDKQGRKNCTICPDQTITVISAAASPLECIEKCKPGTFLNKSKKTCQNCAKGFYQDQQHYILEHCTKCPLANLTTLGLGASSLEQCVGYCASFPCLNGGKCTNLDHNFKCTCSKYLGGKRCEEVVDEKYMDTMQISVRFPSLAWEQSLSRPESKEFSKLANEIEHMVRQEFRNEKAFRTVKVTQFQQGSVISYLDFNYVAGVESPTPVDTLYLILDDGKLGNLVADNSSVEVHNFTCKQPLGMENGQIPDESITAGIVVYYYPPRNARLNFLGVGWAPQYLSGDEVYLQVDFGKVMLLTGIATQGSSFHEGSWLKSYYFQFSSDGGEWTYFNSTGIHYDVFPANDDVNTTVRNDLPVPVKARYIRLFEQHFKEWISYRVEFYGCPIPKTMSTTRVPITTKPETTSPTDELPMFIRWKAAPSSRLIEAWVLLIHQASRQRLGWYRGSVMITET